MPGEEAECSRQKRKEKREKKKTKTWLAFLVCVYIHTILFIHQLGCFIIIICGWNRCFIISASKGEEDEQYAITTNAITNPFTNSNCAMCTIK